MSFWVYSIFSASLVSLLVCCSWWTVLFWKTTNVGSHKCSKLALLAFLLVKGIKHFIIQVSTHVDVLSRIQKASLLPRWPSCVNLMLPAVTACTSLTSPFFCSLFHPFHLSLPLTLPSYPPSFLSFQCPGLADHVPADDSQADVWALSGLWGGFHHQLEWRKGCSYTGSLAEEILWGKGHSALKWERKRAREEKGEKKSTLNPLQPHCKSLAGYRWTWKGPIQSPGPW